MKSLLLIFYTVNAIAYQLGGQQPPPAPVQVIAPSPVQLQYEAKLKANKATCETAIRELTAAKRRAEKKTHACMEKMPTKEVLGLVRQSYFVCTIQLDNEKPLKAVRKEMNAKFEADYARLAQQHCPQQPAFDTARFGDPLVPPGNPSAPAAKAPALAAPSAPSHNSNDSAETASAGQ